MGLNPRSAWPNFLHHIRGFFWIISRLALWLAVALPVLYVFVYGIVLMPVKLISFREGWSALGELLALDLIGFSLFAMLFVAGIWAWTALKTKKSGRDGDNPGKPEPTKQKDTHSLIIIALHVINGVICIELFLAGMQEMLILHGIYSIAAGIIGFFSFILFPLGIAVVESARNRRSTGRAAFGRRRGRNRVLLGMGWIMRLISCTWMLFGVIVLISEVLSSIRGPDIYAQIFFALTIIMLGRFPFKAGRKLKAKAKYSFEGDGTPSDSFQSRRRRGRRWTARAVRAARAASVVIMLSGATMVIGGLRNAAIDGLSAYSTKSYENLFHEGFWINIAISLFGLGFFRLGLFTRRLLIERSGNTEGLISSIIPKKRTVFGQTYRAIGRITWLGGMAVMVLGFLGVRGILNSFISIPFYVSIPLFIVLGCSGYLAMRCGSLLKMKSDRYLANVVTSLDNLIPGSYVLYLRPFSQDPDAARQIAENQQANFMNNPFFSILHSSRTNEERLGSIFAEYGPLLAIGAPGEPVPGGAGALRAYLPLNDWQDTVGDLIGNARLIILGAGSGPGTLWEYVEVLRRRIPSRLVLLITDAIDYKYFKASSIAEIEGVLYELKNKHGYSWEAPILPDLPSYAETRSDKNFWLRAMVYFVDQWEPRMIKFDTASAFGNYNFDNVRIVRALKPMMRYLSGSNAGRSVDSLDGGNEDL